MVQPSSMSDCGPKRTIIKINDHFSPPIFILIAAMSHRPATLESTLNPSEKMLKEIKKSCWNEKKTNKFNFEFTKCTCNVQPWMTQLVFLSGFFLKSFWIKSYYFPNSVKISDLVIFVGILVYFTFLSEGLKSILKCEAYGLWKL